MKSREPSELLSTQERVRILLESLLSYDPDRIYLFGSAARGEDDELSDLDIVVILRTSEPFFDRLLMLGRALPLDLGAVDMLAYSPDEREAMLASGNAFAEMVAQEGKVLYERPSAR